MDRVRKESGMARIVRRLANPFSPILGEGVPALSKTLKIIECYKTSSTPNEEGNGTNKWLFKERNKGPFAD